MLFSKTVQTGSCLKNCTNIPPLMSSILIDQTGVNHVVVLEQVLRKQKPLHHLFSFLSFLHLKTTKLFMSIGNNNPYGHFILSSQPFR